MLNAHDKPQHVNSLVPIITNDHSSCFGIDCTERYQSKILLSHHWRIGSWHSSQCLWLMAPYVTVKVSLNGNSFIRYPHRYVVVLRQREKFNDAFFTLLALFYFEYPHKLISHATAAVALCNQKNLQMPIVGYTKLLCTTTAVHWVGQSIRTQ